MAPRTGGTGFLIRSGRRYVPDPEDTRPRLFVAVPLADAAREEIVALVGAVRDEVDSTAREPRSAVRWVRMEGLHLTLRFLGPTDTAQVPAVVTAVRRAGAGTAPFDLTVAGAGAFPTAVRPRTIWLRVTTGADALAALAARLDGELESDGWPREARPFRAHVTLARADGRREGPLVVRRLVDRMAGTTIPSRVDRIVLFESVTGSGPARYVPVAEVPLGPS